MIVVTGAAGYLGRLTIDALTATGPHQSVLAIDRIGSASNGRERHPPAGRVRWQIGDITAASTRAAIDWPSVSALIHLPALTTMTAEADFDAAAALNIDATVALLQACRAEGERRGAALRMVFASSVGVFAGGVARVDETTPVSPASTYGFTKVVAEHYLAEYRRRGWVDAITLRLPVCIVRPGRTLRTSAGFLSDLVCRLAAGEPFTLPMPPDRRLPVASSRAAASALAHLAVAPAPSSVPLLHLPALAVSATDVLRTFERIGTRQAIVAPRVEIDDTVMRVTAGWPERFETREAAALPAPVDATLEAIVRRYLSEHATPGAPQTG